MALTESRSADPDSVTDAPSVAGPAPQTLDGLFGSADHKTIGRFWISAGLLFLVASLVISAVAALEAIDLDGFSVMSDADQFTQVWSLGRELLLLGALVPLLVGLATYLVPLQIGAPAIAFARGASGAFWTWLIGTGLMIAAYLLNGGPGGGRIDLVVLWVASLALMIGGILWALVIVAATILGARTAGMTLDRAPFTTWAFLVFSLFGLFSLPVTLAELALTYVRLRHGFVPLEDRQSLVGVFHSLSLAPSLYWLAIPALGMAADAIGVHTAKPVRMHRPVMGAIGLLGLCSFGVTFFGFASVRAIDFNNAVLVIDLALAVLAVLGVLALAGDSIRTGTVKFNVALVGSLLAGVVFLLATVASLLGLAEPVALFINDKTPWTYPEDSLLILNGTTFHDGIRGLVVGATVVAITAALHHWAAKIWGRRLAEPLGFLAILASAGGAVLWGLGAILAGVDDQPDYPAATLGGGSNVEFFNLIALVGIVALTAGAVLTALNAAQSALGRNTTSTGRDWSGATLEWATSSPPSRGNFDRPPVVTSATPLADAAAAAAASTGDSAGGEA